MVSISTRIKDELVTRISGKLYNTFHSQNERLTSTQIMSAVDAAVESSFKTRFVAENKQVNILLSDLRGFTAMSEDFPAQKVMNILNGYFEIMCPIIIKYGGTIDKFMGDSIMAIFGVPSSQSDDLERTIACAVEMQLAMSDLNQNNLLQGLPSLYMGIGINTGMVVAGDIGSNEYSEYTVIGDEVNLTSRIEAQCLRGQILISDNTYKQAKEYIDVRSAVEVYVKGKQKPVIMYELVGTSKPTSLISPVLNARKEQRVQVNMPITFHCVSGKIIDPESNCGTITDISCGGFQTIIPKELDHYSEVKLALSLSLMSQESKDVYAKILRKEKIDNGYRYSMEFTFIDSASQATLKQFVDSMVCA
mgnify:CR=1 FL=1